jgi:phosphatidylglycerol:prolipoprotein diacylglycerol transferase
MLPVLFTVGPLPISSFGVFLGLGLLLSSYAIWRVSRSYDFDKETIFDFIILTFFGGLIFARIVTVLMHLSVFNGLDKILLLNRYPGLSFWGALLGSSLTLWFLSWRKKINFWEMADFACAGALLGMAFADFGCFFGGCSYGVPSDSFLAFAVTGIVGKRLAVSLIEGLIFLFFFWRIWKQVIRFHFTGKILAMFLLFVGITKLALESYRGDQLQIIYGLSFGHVASLLTLMVGIWVYYHRSRRVFVRDIRDFVTFPVSPRRQRIWLLHLRKGWYNQRVNWAYRLKQGALAMEDGPKRLMKRLHVKPTPKHLN